MENASGLMRVKGMVAAVLPPSLVSNGLMLGRCSDSHWMPMG
jgi:hypothetical protein